MVQHAAVTFDFPWTHPDGLTDLLNYLRQQNYDITVHEYAVAQDLVLGLVARGKNVVDQEVMKSYLGPIICKNPREQSNFPFHFDRWSATRSTPAQLDHHHKQSPESELELAGRGWRKWQWILVGFAVVVMIAIAWLWRDFHVVQIAKPQPEAVTIVPGAPPVNPRIPVAIVIYAAAGLFLTLISWGLWWYYRGRLFLSRRTTVKKPDIVSVSLESRGNAPFDRVLLKNTTRELRRRYPEPSTELAIAPTVEETVRHFGRFTPIFRTRLVAPEYLALIDRKTFRDHSSRFADELLGVVAADQVRIEKFYFDGDPRIVFSPAANDPPLTLQDLSTKYLDHRLLLFTDGAGLFDSVSGEPHVAMQSLWCWPSIGLFTPKPPESWGYAERVLADRALVHPATLESLLSFARQLNGGCIRVSESSSTRGAIPTELAERPDRWLERDAPELSLVRQVLQSLRWYLGEQGYFWLTACAVYPEIQFDLTVYLGKNLKDATDRMLFSTERLKALSRLPWLRQGYMPDWLRLELVSSLSRQENSQIRQALDRLWLAAVSGSTSAIKIEVARRHRYTMSALARSVFYRLQSQSAPEDRLRDYVFASVMLGRSLEPLAVRVPRMWRLLLKRRKEGAAVQALQSSLQRWTLRVVTAGSIGSSLFLLLTLPFNSANTFWEAAPIYTILGICLISLAGGLVWLDRHLIQLTTLLTLSLILGGLLGVWLSGMVRSTPVTYERSADKTSDPELAQRLEQAQMNYERQEREKWTSGLVASMWLLTATGLWVFGSQKRPRRNKEAWSLGVVRGLFYAGAVTASILPSITYVIARDGPVWIWIIYFTLAMGLGFAISTCGIRLGSRALLGYGLSIEFLFVWFSIGGASLPESYYMPISLTWTMLALVFSFLLWRRLRSGVVAEQNPSTVDV